MENLDPTPKQVNALRKQANKFFYGMMALSLVLSFVCAKVVAPSDYHPVIITKVTRSLNTAYQPSTTRPTIVTIPPQITSTLSLTGGQSGTVTIQISADNGVTDPYDAVATGINNNTGALTIGLNTSQSQAGSLVAILPPGYYYKLVSSGTSTFAILKGQEAIF